MAQMFLKEEWRYVSIMPGAPSALVLSVKMMLRLYAGKLDTFHQVYVPTLQSPYVTEYFLIPVFLLCSSKYFLLAG